MSQKKIPPSIRKLGELIKKFRVEKKIIESQTNQIKEQTELFTETLNQVVGSAINELFHIKELICNKKEQDDQQIIINAKIYLIYLTLSEEDKVKFKKTNYNDFIRLFASYNYVKVTGLINL